MSNLLNRQDSIMWDEKKKGFYEAYYVQCNDPVSGMAWWFRYSILIPKEGHGHPYAALWAVQYDQSGARGNIALKDIYPISHYRFEKDRFILYIEDGFLTNSHAHGNISHGRNKIEWDIQWTPVDSDLFHFPPILYKLPFPKSKLSSPHWATTGGGFIRWNDNEFYLKDSLIHVGHVWGTSHSKKWAWIHSHGFEEDPTVGFEGIWTPLVGSTGLSMTLMQIDGEFFRDMKCGFNWQLSRFLRENNWRFKIDNNSVKGEGIVTIDPTLVAGVTYHDPDGSHRYCYNSKLASIRMDLYDKKGKNKFTLTAPHTTGFEVCLDKPIEKFRILA